MQEKRNSAKKEFVRDMRVTRVVHVPAWSRKLLRPELHPESLSVRYSVCEFHFTLHRPRQKVARNGRTVIARQVDFLSTHICLLFGGNLRVDAKITVSRAPESSQSPGPHAN